jgi:hypothetical protein
MKTALAADDSAQQHTRFSREDRAAFLDARIAALKAGLELNAEQEKNWPPLESAMRDLARNGRPASPHGGRDVRAAASRRETTRPPALTPLTGSPAPRNG